MSIKTTDSNYFISNGAGSVEMTRGPVEASAGELLIRTEFTGVNRGDVLGLRGAYGEPTPLGQRVGQDLVGIVEAAGSPEDEHLVGERVFGQVPGTWGQHVAAPSGSVAPVLGLQPETAATLPLAGFTALRLARQAEHHAGNLDGKNVLITGGTGAVGSILSQLLMSAGATVWVLTRRPDAPQPVGARAVTTQDQVPDIDVAFESVGGPLLDETLQKLAPHGHLWWFGEASRRPATIDFFSYLGRSPWHLHHFAHWVHHGTDVEDLTQLRDLVTVGALTAPQPRIIRPRDLAQAIEDIAEDRSHDKLLVAF